MAFILAKETADAILDSADRNGAVMLYAANAEDEAVLTACAAEVRVLLEGAWANIMKIGGVLKTAKGKCAWGTWEKWIKTECGFSLRTASRYISVYERFRENEKVLALPGSLSYALLGVPDDEAVNELADQAVEEGWSERELKQEIARRKKAEKAAEETAKELESAVQTAQEIEDDLEKEKAELQERLRAANERSDAFAQNLVDANEGMQRLRTELAAARRAQAQARIVEKSVEVYPMDYDQAKEDAKNYKGVSIAQQEEIAQLRKELAEAKNAAAKTEADANGCAMTAEQFGDAITIFFSRTADVARQPFDEMPAGAVGAFLDQVGRVERFCADLREMIEG